MPRKTTKTKKDKSVESYIEDTKTTLRLSSKRVAVPAFNFYNAVSTFNGLVYAAITLNSNAAAAIPLRLYIKRGVSKLVTKKVPRYLKEYLSGNSRNNPSSYVMNKTAEFRNDYEEVVDLHPILKLLKYPNDWTTGFSFSTARFNSLQLTGNWFVHTVPNEAEVPGNLLLMPAQYITITPGTETLVDHYEYTNPPGEGTIYGIDEVIQAKLQENPKDPFFGLGPVEAGWNIIQTIIQQELYDYFLYANKARPDYLLVVKNGLTEATYRRLQARLDSKLKGHKNAGKFLTIDSDVDLKPLQWTPKDLGSRQDELEKFCAIFHLSISQLKMNDANYSAAQAGNSSWLRNGVQPLLNTDADAWNKWLLPMYGEKTQDYMFLAYDDVVPDDKQYALDRDTRFVQFGITTANEVREDYGYPPAPDGDILRYNGVSVTQMQQNTPNNEPVIQQTKPDVSPEITSALDGITWTLNNLSERVNGMAKSLKHLKTKLKKKPEKPKKPPCNRTLEDMMIDLFSSIKSEVLSLFNEQNKALEGDTVEEIVQKLIASLNTDLQNIMKEILINSATKQLTELGLSTDIFNVSNPEVAEFIKNYSIKLIRQLSNETISRIHEEIETGLNEGGRMEDIIKNIEESDGWSSQGIKNRSELIARSETARAQEAGKMEGAKQSGAVSGTKWIAGPGECEACTEAARIWNSPYQPLDSTPLKAGSVVGGYTLKYGDVFHPPFHPQCRCVLELVLKEDVNEE